MPPRSPPLAATLCLVLCPLLACDDPATSGSGGGASTSDSTGHFMSATSSTGSGQDGCTDATRLVYLLGNQRELVQFNPATLELKEIGKVDCPVQGGPAVPTPKPFSMAVDRSGFALVLYDDGNLFRMDVTNADCNSTAFVPHQSTAFDRFGMGYVADQPGAQAETLYVSAYDSGFGVGVLDAGTLEIERVGFYDKVAGAAEMTGTGDARLYGFFLTEPVEVAEINKATSKVISEKLLPTVHIGEAWAFAFWGGDFWLFTSPNGTTSKVDRYRPSDGSVETVIEDTGIEIVGAGVSTCAPLVPPS